LNLQQLKENINYQIENLNDKQPQDIPVLITLSEPSMGARASCQVKYISMGIDWEHGQFRIEPNQPLVHMGNSLQDIKKAVQYDFIDSMSRKCYWCPTCNQKVAKDDYYCRCCGQKLR
jgi:hypothetical protein